MGGRLHFQINGLNGRSTIGLDFTNNATIIVGPNGSGKSTAISVFYLAITGQWDRLVSGFRFESLTLTTDTGSAVLTREQIESMAHSRERGGNFFDRYVTRLGGIENVSEFITTEFNAEARNRYSKLLAISPSRLEDLQRDLRHSPFGSSDALVAIEKFSALYKDRVIYLPTYRRIEQDLQKLNPELFERSARYQERELKFARKNERFHEVIEFGMQDVQALWDQESASIREFSRSQLNSLTSGYLRDVIRGSAESIAIDFPTLTDERIRDVLSRADVASLTDKDKEQILEKIGGMRDMAGEKIRTEDTYLAKYFTLLVEVVQKIEERENHLRQLAGLIHEYLGPSKTTNYDIQSCSIGITQDGVNIKLSDLSSGEKQVVSMFSYLYLGHDGPVAVIVDEPELSLSVIWQARFLSDVVSAPCFGKLIAVTHSPFVYDNELSGSVVDFSTCTIPFHE